MRAATLIVVSLLLTLPVVGSLEIGRVQPPVAAGLQDVHPLFPDDFPDAALVLMLATHMGVPAVQLPPVVVSDELTLPDMVQRLALRAGGEVGVEDAAAFALVDARVAVPVLELLVAVDAAWTLRDAAFARLTLEEQVELSMLAKGELVDEARLDALGELVELEPLINGAILLLDTIEARVIPALQEAIALGVWPEEAVADPVGVLRLGSPGDDVETLFRIVQIDPSGNDTYHNNAGGTNMGSLNPEMRFPVSVSIDFEGDDVYYTEKRAPAQGGGDIGIGILYDLAGDDSYFCKAYCLGAGLFGFGYIRELAGNDSYDVRERAMGAGLRAGIGVLRDDAGNDHYIADYDAGGFASSAPSTGLLWDRGGVDQYEMYTCFAAFLYGWAASGGRGWMVDEGPDIDYYASETGCASAVNHGCNNCSWYAGDDHLDRQGLGGGNDNYGGLGFMIGTEHRLA